MIEAVYWRNFHIFAVHCKDVNTAVELLKDGEEKGQLSSVGVFMDGIPVLLTDYPEDPREPTPAEQRGMLDDYADVVAGRAQVVEHKTHVEVRGGAENVDTFTGDMPENPSAGGSWPDRQRRMQAAE